MAKQAKGELLESSVVHFTIGDDLGIRLMEIAQEHLTERNDPVKALRTITESLQGCPTDLAVQILKGDIVLFVENQQVLTVKRAKSGVEKIAHDKIFPKVDPCYFIEKRKNDIISHGENLIAGFKELQKQIRIDKRYITLTLSYDEIFKFVSGKDENILDTLRDNWEIDAIVSLFETARKYIEFTMSIISTMDWMLKSFDEFSDSKLYVEYNGMKGDCQQMLTDVMFILKETLNFEFDMNEIQDFDNVQKYIESAREIDAVIEKGIEPCNIMDNYTAGWLAPNGDYYGLNGEIANMLHIQIADALVEKGIIPLKDSNGDKIEGALADQWLEQNGWVKIHGANVQFAGCLNDIRGKKNVDLTNVQIQVIYKYIQELHNGIIKLGWRLTPVSAVRFKTLADNLPAMYKEYFGF